MEDATLVRIVYCLGDGLEQGGGAPGGYLPSPDQFGKIAAIHVIHREVGLPFMLADLVYGHDVRVLEAGSGLGFYPESSDKVVTGQLAEEQHFYRDEAIERDLPSPIDNPHAASGNFLEQLVIAEVVQNERGSPPLGYFGGRW